MRFKIIPLEERIVLDAGGLAALIASHAIASYGIDTHDTTANVSEKTGLLNDTTSKDSASQSPIDPGDTSTQSGERVLVVSSAVQDSLVLAEAALSNVKVVYYDPNTTSLSDLSAKIAAVLHGQKAESIAFANHGTEGEFDLTQDIVVSLNTLQSSPALEAFWENVGQMIQSGGHVDLLACSVAGSTAGLQLVTQLDNLIDAHNPQATVDASTDLTGNASSGGNWNLEVGNVDAAHTYFNTTELAQFSGVLTTFNVNATPISNLTALQEVNGPVATLTNITAAQVSEATATINWGDSGPSTTGTIVPNPSGGYYVVGDHTYTNGSTDTSITVTVTSGSDSANASEAVPIAGPAIVPATNITPIDNNPFSGAIGTVSDTASNLASATVTIDYGDNSGIVDGSLVNNGNGTYTIDAPAHTYTDGGTYNVTATVQESNGTTSTTVTPFQVSGPEITPDTISINNGLISAYEGIGFLADPSIPISTLGKSTVSIDWGDKTADTSGTLFDVSALSSNPAPYIIETTQAHQYSEPGKYTIFITVTEPGGASSTYGEQVNVPIFSTQLGIAISSPTTLNANSQVDFLQNLASFNDLNGGNATSFVAIVDWGDGGATPDTSIATVTSNGSGGYNITGSHDYATPGIYTAKISVQDAAGSTASVNDTIDVTKVVENQSFSAVFIGNLPAFNPNAISETATINWGDNTSSAATIFTDSSTGIVYLEPPAHTYAEAGTYDPFYTITVKTVAFVNGEPVFSTFTYPETTLHAITVADAPLVPTLSPVTTFNVSTYEDLNNQSAPVTLAQFTDEGATSTSTADYLAIVSWGDGTTTIDPITGVDTNGSIIFSVMGNHNYANIGTGVYDPVITIKDAGGSSVQIGDVVNVSSLAINQAFTTTLQVPLTFPFLDPITATVSWGDGSTTPATYGIDLFDGLYNIFASHTYTTEGSFTPIVNITDTRTNQTIQDTTSPIEVSSFNLTPKTISAVTEGQTLPNTIIAILNDSNLTRNPSSYTVTGTWGDGESFSSADDVHLVQVSLGIYDVEASHTFGDAGSGILSITVTDPNGGSVTINDLNPVTDPPLSVTASNINDINAASTQFLLGTFTDPGANANSLASDYLVTITFNGQSSITLPGSDIIPVLGQTGVYDVYTTLPSLSGETGFTLTAQEANNANTIGQASGLIDPITTGSYPSSLTSREGIASTFVFGTVQDPAGITTASINWGDGSQSENLILNSENIIYDAHLYADAGTYSPVVTFTNALGTYTEQYAVEIDISGIQGTAVTGTLNLGSGILFGSPTVNIFWGDGQESTNLPVQNTNDEILVNNLNHTYADQGNYTITYDLYETLLPPPTLVKTGTIEANIASDSLSISPDPIFGTAMGSAIPAGTVLATFTDDDTSAQSMDYIATVDWLNNGNAVAAQVVGGNGSFSIESLAGYSYQDLGYLNAKINVVNNLTNSSAQVLDPVALGVNLTVSEGALVPNIIGEVGTGSNFPSLITINGPYQDESGIGAPVSSFEAGVETIYADFAFTEAGNYTVTVQYQNNQTLTSYFNVVDPGPLQISSPLVLGNGQEGQSLALNDVLVADFKDPGNILGIVLSDYSASVNWGDGTPLDTTTTTISPDGNGGFDVYASHTYAEANISGYSPQVTVSADLLSAQVKDIVNVTDSISATGGMNFNITEGQALAAGTIIGQLIDGDTTTSNSSDFTLSGSWGDGNAFVAGDIGLVPIQNENGVYNIVINNSHTYAEYSNNPEQLTINIVAIGSSPVTIMDSVQVNDATISASNVSTLNFIEGQTLAAGTILGQLTDGDTTTSNPSDFSFTGSWGDGNNFAVGDIGLVATGNAGSGTYNIVAENPHTYAEFLPNGGNLTINVQDAGGSSASITDQVQVSDAQISVTGVNAFSLTEGQALAAGTIIGHLQDANTVTSNINDFTLSGSWGDGNNFAMGDVSLVALGSGDYNIVTDNAHTYAEFLPNGGQISILVNDAGGYSSSATDNISIADAPISATGGHNFSLTQGQALAAGTIIGQLTDGDTTTSNIHDFTLSGSWGDGNNFAAGDISLVSLGGGVYNVVTDVAHTYSQGLNGQINININDAGSSSASTYDNIQVTSIISATGNDNLNGVAGTALPNSSILATFTDTNSAVKVANLSATIDWFDNGSDVTTGSVALSGTSFVVKGGFDYTVEGSYTPKVMITDKIDNVSTTVLANVQIADAAIIPGAKTISLTEGQALSNAIIGTFTDKNPYATYTEFTATIDWGDSLNTMSTGIVVADGTHFDVLGSFGGYLAGKYTPTIIINDLGGYSVNDTSTTINVSLAALTPTAVTVNSIGGQPLVEGQTLPANTILATFTDGNPQANAGNFSATIDWGNGPVNASVVANNGGGFAVEGGFTYAEEGTYHPKIVITDTLDSVVKNVTGTVIVADAPISLSPQNVTATEGMALNNVVVAILSDGYLNAPISDFTTDTITWGDGSTSKGTLVSLGNGQFDVLGTHTYATSNPDPIGSVLIKDKGGSTSSVNFNVSILPVSLPASYVDAESNPASPTQLAVGALNGVLALDQAPNHGEVITAELLSGPSNGTLTLNADGSFSYTANPNFIGIDHFSYAAVNDQMQPGAPSIVTIKVEGKPAVQLNSSGLVDSTEDAAAVALDPTATATYDAISNPSLQGSTLTVSLAANGVSTDHLVINKDTIVTTDSSKNVYYNGIDIGTYQGGSSTSPLIINFNAAATINAVNAVMEHVAFSSTGELSLPDRVVQFVFQDPSGATSDAQTQMVHVVLDNDASISSSGSIKATENTILDIGAVSNLQIKDTESPSNTITINLSVSDGTLDFTDLNGLGNINFFNNMPGPQGLSSLILQGSLSDINLALSKLTYMPDLNYTGKDSLSILVTDQPPGPTGVITGSGVPDASKLLSITIIS